MTELLTAAQMRAIEQAAIASGEVTGLELMERAGRGVVEAIFEEWPELAKTSHRAVVLCGPGNNGGDGFVVARLLKEWGWEVEVFLYGDPSRLPPDAQVNYERWQGMGEVGKLPPDVFHAWSYDLTVDALFGTGLTRGLEWGLANVLPEWDLRDEPGRPRVVAVDVPSGLCSDSGRALEGDGLWADLTVTFHRPKIGHFVDRGPFYAGRVVVKPLWEERGRDAWPDLKINGQTLTMPMPWDEMADGVAAHELMRAKLCKTDPFGEPTHKYTHGHALILSGPPGQTGAARLAARGALRIGAGLVSIGATPEAIPEHAAQLNAIMLRPVADAEALGRVLDDRRINALCLGPGLGLNARARALVAEALQIRGEPRSTVLDADALTILSQDPDLFSALHEGCILTPHAGEFARLFPDITEKLAAPATKGPAYSKVDAAREAAKRAGCVVLYKGPDTVIADPSGCCAINSAHYDRAAPWLATAGSGDVLAGFIAGLLARGFAPMQAAESAVWLHVECALKFGPGLIAEDLPEQLPAVFRDLGL